jgi:hypothetical protein
MVGAYLSVALLLVSLSVARSLVIAPFIATPRSRALFASFFLFNFR